MKKTYKSITELDSEFVEALIEEYKINWDTAPEKLYLCKDRWEALSDGERLIMILLAELGSKLQLAQFLSVSHTSINTVVKQIRKKLINVESTDY